MKVELLLFLLHCVSCVVCFPSVLREGEVPIYLYKIKAVLLSILSVKAWDAPPLDGSMPPPEQCVAEQRRQGVAHPLGLAAP